MTLVDVAQLFGAFVAGMGLGGIFFGGLWLTLRLGLSSVMLGPSLIGSFMLRVSIVLAGVYLVCAGDWRRLLLCLVGFTVTRLIVTV